ncbi:hypothetical protein B0H14DRAFT_3459214 [Mycena olivaceomarginata]|nr:hypothetical protein B0H14DRAFT_3459214 [Mycena olivaceomarginata]
MSKSSLSSAQTQRLSGTESTTRSIAGACSKCNERSRRPCRLQRLPAPGAGFLCAHAGLRDKPPPAAQREHDGHHPPRCAAHPAAVPPSPLIHVHPQCHTAPLVDDSAAPPPPMRTHGPHGGDVHPARPPVPAFHARDLRPARMGTATSLGATNPGGDNGTYAAPGFQIAPRPVQFESPARAVSTGRGTA